MLGLAEIAVGHGGVGVRRIALVEPGRAVTPDQLGICLWSDRLSRQGVVGGSSARTAKGGGVDQAGAVDEVDKGGTLVVGLSDGGDVVAAVATCRVSRHLRERTSFDATASEERYSGPDLRRWARRHGLTRDEDLNFARVHAAQVTAVRDTRWQQGRAVPCTNMVRVVAVARISPNAQGEYRWDASRRLRD